VRFRQETRVTLVRLAAQVRLDGAPQRRGALWPSVHRFPHQRREFRIEVHRRPVRLLLRDSPVYGRREVRPWWIREIVGERRGANASAIGNDYGAHSFPAAAFSFSMLPPARVNNSTIGPDGATSNSRITTPPAALTTHGAPRS
jgi:hypothetical protein